MRYFSLLLIGVVAIGCSKPADVRPIGAVSSEASRTKSVVPIVELRGDGTAIGAEHGKALSNQIHTLHELYLKTWFEDPKTYQRASIGAIGFWPHLRAEHWEEIHAIAQSTAIEQRDILLANCFLDLAPMTACSTVALPASASPDGVARFGRNLDFPSFDIADKNSVLLVYHPKDKYAFAAVSWPGLVGVLSGMNEHGLTLANMEVTRPTMMPHAMPYALLYRCVLEQCKTVDEAIELLKTTPRQTSNNLMLMDANGDRAVCEISASEVKVRRAGANEPLVSTNFQFKGRDRARSPQCARYDHLMDASGKSFGKIDVAAIEKMLGEVAQGDFTLQSMVFEPSTRVVYLAVGKDAANKSSFERVELGKLFRQ